METSARHTVFEEGDNTALVCIEDAVIQDVVIEQLSGLSYKIQTGLFLEDISLKLRAHMYDVVVIYETFGGSDLSSNQVLKEISLLPMSQRRKQFIVLVGPNMATNNYMEAFKHSVDLVFSVADLENLRPVVRRGVMQQQLFYSNFSHSSKELGII